MDDETIRPVLRSTNVAEMSTVAVPKGMTLPQYLNQGQVWIDGRSGTCFTITAMDRGRREYAIRELSRQATAFISLMEVWKMVHGDTAGMVGLISTSPRTWMAGTNLFRALSNESRSGSGHLRTTEVVVDSSIERSSSAHERDVPLAARSLGPARTGSVPRHLAS